MELNQLLELLSGYPTGIYTILIGVLLVFWLFAILGALDIDILSFDADLDFDGEVEIPGFVGLLHTLGLTGVPFTIVLSILIFIAWVLTYVVSAYVLPLVPTAILKFVLASATLVGAFVIAVPITAKVVSPLRKLSLENTAKSNKDYLGAVCKVTSLNVDESFGQGKIQTTGTSLIVRIRAVVPNEIKKGDIVRPISYSKLDNVYHVVTNEEFENSVK